MFDLSEVGTDFSTFTSLTKRYLINCLVGNANLTATNGDLIDYFDEIIEEVIEWGEIAIIQYPDTEEKYLAIPQTRSLFEEENTKLKRNLLKEPVELEFQLLDNEKETISGEKVEKYVIFKFNKEGTSHLTGLSFWTKRLSNILKQMEKELFMNEKRLIFFSPETPDKLDTKKWLKQFTDGIMTFITFDKSANPDKDAIKEGKQGINPNLVKFQVYEPKEFQEEKYRKQFDFNWTNMEKSYGVRHDALQVKEERASVTEVFNSQASFDAQERKIFRCLWKSILEYNRTFDEGKANYQFSYGRISSNKNTK